MGNDGGGFDDGRLAEGLWLAQDGQHALVPVGLEKHVLIVLCNGCMCLLDLFGVWIATQQHGLTTT